MSNKEERLVNVVNFDVFERKEREVGFGSNVR
jgi:hypothetical protein